MPRRDFLAKMLVMGGVGAVGGAVVGGRNTKGEIDDLKRELAEFRVELSRQRAVDSVQNRLTKDVVEMSVLAIHGIEVEDSTFNKVFQRAVGKVQEGMSEWHPDLLVRTEEDAKKEQGK